MVSAKLRRHSLHVVLLCFCMRLRQIFINSGYDTVVLWQAEKDQVGGVVVKFESVGLSKMGAAV